MHKVENFSSVKPKAQKSKAKDMKFKEILCPMTKNGLIVRNCTSCKHCQTIQSMHHSGRSLTSMICLYGANNEGDQQ